MKKVACTIVSANYLPYARTLCESYLRQHPHEQFYVLLVDTIPEGFDRTSQPYELILITELNIPSLTSIAFKYDLLELNTNVKPSFLKMLLAKGHDKVIYLDPDIYVFASLEPIYSSLDNHSIVITPHITQPVSNADRNAEQVLLRLGVFNFGFLAVSQSSEASKFLEWWEDRCLNLAYAEARSGLYVDQKWGNLVPCLFDRVCVLKHSGCNVAYWNVQERSLTKAGDSFFVNGGTPLLFFHFSGVDLSRDDVLSTKGLRPVKLEQNSALREIFFIYRDSVAAARKTCHLKHQYAFGQFSNGVAISTIARRIYASSEGTFPADGDPFDANSTFYQFARKQRLIGASDTSQKYDINTCPKADPRLRVIHLMMRLILRLVGNDRYTALLKYLAHFSVLRHQVVLFGDI